MKTQFLNFGGGIITGLLLVLLFSASTNREEPEVHPTVRPESVQARFIEVPIRDFFQDVANYRDQHVRLVQGRLPDNKLASRMFIYSVPVLESFFEVIRAHARTAQLKPEQLAIRFYYAAYPRDKRIDGQDYGLLHTLFMVPNYWSVKHQQFKDFDIKALADHISRTGYGDNKDKMEEVIKDYYLENLYERSRSASAFMLDASAITRTASDVVYPEVINQGQLCPPNCPRLSLLDYIDQNFPRR